MATDAEIVAWHRAEAARFQAHVEIGRADAELARSCGGSGAIGDAYAKQESEYAERHARAADAIEENARLRALLDDTVGALESLCGERPAWQWQWLLDEVRAALRKPGAGGSHE